MATNSGDAHSQQPATEVQNAVSFIEKGCKLTKFGSNSKKYGRYFFVDTKIMALCYTGSKKRGSNAKGLQIWVPIRDVVDVMKVDTNATKNRHGKGPSLFTLIISKNSKLKTLIAASVEVRDTWVCGLRHLVSIRSADDPVKQERMWLEECFAYADRNRGNLLDQEEVIRLINSLNVSPADVKYMRERMQSQNLNVEQFIELYNELCKKTELVELFQKFAGHQQYMTVDELSRFFQTEQNEEIPPETLKHVISSCESCPEFRDKERLSLAGFSVMFTTPRMNIKNPRCLKVYQDMTQPLSHYFINSSHNTYLEGHQTVGDSDVEQYRRILSQGCRCVELDVWDGDDGEPVLYHGISGISMTSKVLFSDVLREINNFAFVNNDYPVIVSLENHASENQQTRMAQLIRDTFKDRLYCEPLWHGDARFPSPEDLKGRIIIQGSKPHRKPEDDESEDEVPPEEEVPEANKQLRQYKKTEVEPTQELAKCVSFYQAEPFKNLEESSDKMSFLNISENKVGRWIEKDDGRPFVRFNHQKLSRVYPAWWRMSSNNYNPVPSWTAGCQVVSLNFQTRDEATMLNDGLFEDNGRCGYVLKSELLTSGYIDFGPGSPTHEFTQILTVTVISGYMLPKKPVDSNFDSLDPYVQIDVHGIPADRKTERTSTVQNNSFNPVWNETKHFTVTCPDLALVLFRVADDRFLSDVTMAEYCLPMRCMQTGYRMITLHDKDGDRIGPTSLLVHISISMKGSRL